MQSELKFPEIILCLDKTRVGSIMPGMYTLEALTKDVCSMAHDLILSGSLCLTCFFVVQQQLLS